MRKIIPVVAAGATTLALAGTTFGYANLSKSVTLSVDGQTSEVRTSADTVGALLKSEDIDVNTHDVVAPSLEAKVQDGTRVAFTIDGAEQTIWTTATTVDEALTALAVDLAGAELSTSRSSSIGREGLGIIIATEKTVVIVDAGKKRTVTTTGQTLDDALAAAKITVDHDDKLSASPNAPLVDGAKFTFTRVDVKSKTKKVKVDYDTTRKKTSTLNKLVRHNGELVRRTKIKSKLIKKPVNEVILVGTKTTTKKKSSGSSSSGSSSSSSTPSGSVWDKLAQCESGGNWSINTGNGYYGGLQFSLSTWRAYGGKGYPHQASRDEQIRIAKKLQAAAGWGSWPACSSKLGLR